MVKLVLPVVGPVPPGIRHIALAVPTPLTRWTAGSFGVQSDACVTTLLRLSVTVKVMIPSFTGEPVTVASSEIHWSEPLKVIVRATAVVVVGDAPPAVTFTAIVFGDWSRFTPPLAIAPSSSTWNVKVVYGEPLPPVTGVN